MNDLSVPLRSIRQVFQGMVPTPIATASSDGVPNSTYLSIVWFIDDERIALSNQFMGKTAANLKENPAVALRLVDPANLVEYDIDAIHLRTETSGDVFDAVKTQLEAVAAQSGMADIFRLRGVEILRVHRAERVGPGGEIDETGATLDIMNDLATFVQRLAECRDLAEATRVGLQSLEDLFAFPHSILLSSDEDAGRLFVLAANGYDQEGVGAELRLGEGVIGVAARRLRQVRVESVERGRTLARASQVGGDEDLEIPVPGLPDAQSMVATPLVLNGRLLGVLYVDDARAGRFDVGTGKLIEVLAGHLAVTVALHEAGGVDPAHTPRSGVEENDQMPGAQVVFHDLDGTILVDGEYLIRGVPGRILFWILTENGRTGRTEFTNAELRRTRELELPTGNDNLEARLLTLRRRLAERDGSFRLERIGRGRLRVEIESPVKLVHE